MGNNKETERAELHKTIWKIANDLRGSVDGWDFKSYVLGMLFYRFISENLSAYLGQQERKAGKAGFDYAKLSDDDAEFGRDETVMEKGFYILPSQLFANVRSQAGQNDEEKVYLGADAYPGNGSNANSRMSTLACLAHELAHAVCFHNKYRRPVVLPDVLIDEAETSLNASFNSVLSAKDREDLVEDARDRLIHWLAIRFEKREENAS